MTSIANLIDHDILTESGDVFIPSDGWKVDYDGRRVEQVARGGQDVAIIHCEAFLEGIATVTITTDWYADHSAHLELFHRVDYSF